MLPYAYLGRQGYQGWPQHPEGLEPHQCAHSQQQPAAADALNIKAVLPKNPFLYKMSLLPFF